jgi:hypothetical protein
MSLGDFLASLVDIAIQLAVEVAFKGLFAGAKVLKKKVTTARKFTKGVKFSECLDSVQTKAQFDDLIKKGLQLDEAGQAAFNQADEAAKKAQNEAIYKYGMKQISKQDEAMKTIDNVASYKAELDELFEQGVVDEAGLNKLKELIDADYADEMIAARYNWDDATGKLETIDDGWGASWWNYVKESMSKTGSDDLISKIDNAGSWKSWQNAYLDGATAWYWKVPAFFEWAKLYPQALAATSDTWFGKTMYPFTRRLSGRMLSLLMTFYSSGKAGDDASEDQALWLEWGNRQDLIDDIDGTSESDMEMLSGLYAALTYDRFEWVDATQGSTGTSTRFTWVGESGGQEDQFADKDFAITTHDRFGWVPPVVETETETDDEMQVETEDQANT